MNIQEGAKFLIRGHTYAKRYKSSPEFYELFIFDTVEGKYLYITRIDIDMAIVFCQACHTPVKDNEENLIQSLKADMTVIINTVTSKVEVINENAFTGSQNA